MRRLSHILLLVSLAIWFFGCGKSPNRLDDFRVDFATVLKTGDSYRFQLDNNKILIPNEVKNYDGKTGQRVLLNYIIRENDAIEIRSINDIFTGKIETEGYPEKLVREPVKIQSVWVGGDYLNMILEIEYHSKPHSIAVLQNTQSATTDVYFSHARNDDPPGYPKMMYASFSLASLRNGSSATPFRLFIHTHESMREFNFLLK